MDELSKHKIRIQNLQLADLCSSQSLSLRMQKTQALAVGTSFTRGRRSQGKALVWLLHLVTKGGNLEALSGTQRVTDSNSEDSAL